MNLTKTLAAAAVGALAVTSVANAEVARPYIMLGAGVSILDDVGVSSGTVGSNLETGTGYALSLSGGLGVFDSLRVELEAARRYNGFEAPHTGDIHAHSIMANVIYDIPLRLAGLTPYIGAGAGAIWLSLDNVATASTLGTVDDTDMVWGYQGIAGISAPITNNLTVSLDYRYMSTFDDPSYRTSTGVGVNSEYSDHTIMLGFRWNFGGAPAAAPAPAPTPAAAPAPTPAPAAAPAQQPLVRSFLVFFDFDRSDITEDARKVINQAADNARKAGGASRITLTGHADRAGSTQYNMRLSQRRADAVKAELIRLGVPANEIATVAKGESDPLVPTADGVREPRNRRVEIVF